MKPILSVLCSIIFLNTVVAQSYKVTLSDEIKIRKNTSDLEIISADNTGLYFSESRLKMKSYYVFGASYGISQQLIKFDKNYEEVFRKDYKKELNGLAFNSFQALGNDIFIFATDYIKKEKQFKIYGARINKDNGSLEEEPIELGAFDLESNKDNYEMRLKPVRNGKNLLLVADISSKDHLTLAVSLLNNALVKSASTVITLPYSAEEYTLEDVVLTGNNKIITLGRQYEQIETGKKGKKKNVFKQYQMLVYNAKGQKENDINLNAGERYVIGGTMIEQKEGGILLAGFYSNSPKKDNMSGFFICKVDDVKAELQLTSYKEINSQMMGKNFDRDTSAKVQLDSSADLSSQYVVRSVDINPADSSIVITSEVSVNQPYTFTRSSYSNGQWNYSTYTGYRFERGDILVISTDKDGNIRWVDDIPKTQREIVETRELNSAFSNPVIYFFAENGGMPFYSSFKSVINKNKLVLIFNDSDDNETVSKYGDKVSLIAKFQKSVTYGLSVDLATGEIKRKKISSNDDETVLMPRHSYIVNSEVIIPSLKMNFMSKSQLKFARVTISQ